MLTRTAANWEIRATRWAEVRQPFSRAACSTSLSPSTVWVEGMESSNCRARASGAAGGPAAAAAGAAAEDGEGDDAWAATASSPCGVWGVGFGAGAVPLGAALRGVSRKRCCGRRVGCGYMN